MIFIDSDALIGVIAPQDAHYSQANLIFDHLAETEEKLVTSWETIDEVATKLSMYFGKDIADKFFELINRTHIKIIFIDQKLAPQIIEIFRGQTSKNVSLTDCANIAICRSLGITHIFSFDPHYSRNRLKLLV